MLLEVLFWLSTTAPVPVPPVPGGCTAPASENVGKLGCYLSAELAVSTPPPELYWHIYKMLDEAAAKAEGSRHKWASVVQAHGKTWLYVLDSRAVIDIQAEKAATLGPLQTPTRGPIVARFMESVFPPGMRTRVHSHSGPEAFFVIEGRQCVETPTRQHLITPGSGFIVDAGPHLQASPDGRKSLVLILAAADAPWMKLEDNWRPSGYCDG